MSLDLLLRELLREVVRDEIRAAFDAHAVSTNRAESTHEDPMYLSAERAAQIADIRPATIREWVTRGELRGYYAGRLLRVRRDELEQYMARCSGPTSDVIDIRERARENLERRARSLGA